MRTFNRIVLFGMVLISLILTCSSFPNLADTYASFSDAKYVDGTLTAAVWDTQAYLVGLSDLKLMENSTKTQETNQSFKGNSYINGHSLENSTNNSSAPGKATLNLSTENLTAGNQTADNLTNNTTSDSGNGMGGSSGPAGPEQPSEVTPIANFSSNVTSGYAPISIQFTDLSENSTQWNWDFGDGGTSTEQSPAHTYSFSGTYSVNLVATNAKSTNSKTGTITVLEKPVVIPPPVANFSSNVSSGYAPLSVQFTDLSENVTEWSWNFGDGGTSTEQSPAHTYLAAGKYTVNLTAANVNGTSSKLSIITVVAPPVPPVSNFTSNVSSGYASLSVQFTDLSENSTGWSWDFGDGITSIEQNPEHIYFAAGNYTVNMTASNGNGTSSKLAAINVVEQIVPVLPAANFSSDITSGYAPLVVQFIDLSDNATQWNWDFGDGDTSTLRSPAHTYSFSGTYNVNLVATNANGTDSKTGTITVLEKPVVISPPVANFSSNVSSGYALLSVQFTDLSENATGWSWNFGDGITSIEQNPVHTYFAAGNYTVNLTASNGNGTNSTFSTISVLQPVLPVANFNSNVTSGYPPLTVQFTDLSENTTEWNWNFGDGITSSEPNPVHTYSAAGDYSVNLTAANPNGKDSRVVAIEVFEQTAAAFPVSDFTSNVKSGYIPPVLSASNSIIYVSGDGSGNFNCDGIDDNVQIQQAFDYANSYPGTVVHLKGPFTYQISKQMTIGSYTTLEGDSTAKMQIKANAGWSSSGDSTDGSNAMIYGKSSGVHDITFQGFEMDGNFDNQGGLSHGQGYLPAVILQTGCYNITFQNMYAHNFGDDILRVYYSTPIDSSNKGNIIFRNNVIYKGGHEGLYALGCNNVQFYNNDVYTWADCAVRPVCCNHVKIYNNNLHAEYSGQASGALIELQRNDADGITDDAEIYNNTMHTTVGVGVYMHGKDSSGICSGKNVWIHNNIFYNVGQYDWFGTLDPGEEGGFTQKGIIVGYWDNTTIENNVFDNAGSGVIYSGSNCDGNYFSSDVYTTIRNNIFINTQYVAGRAIEVYDTHQHFSVVYNDFYNNKADFYGSVTQSNNIFTDPKVADAANHDYHLQSNSPCIGAGLNGVNIGASTGSPT